MEKGLRTVSAVVFVLLTLGTLWVTNRPVAVLKSDWQDVVREAQVGHYQIIKLEALWKRYQQSPTDLLLVDTRQSWEHRSGFIKGSVNFPMEPTWWSRWRNKEALGEFLGPDKSKLIVFY